MSSQYDLIPSHMMGAMQVYVDTGTVSSDFLKAVIENDLRAAVSYADDYNRGILWLYVMWFHNRAPALCWGSPLNRTAWADITKRLHSKELSV